MPRDTGIADRLRAKGLNVVEVNGWRTRGAEGFNPRGSVDHHTAGPRKGNAPSLGVCINGRADLPGPLCNVLVGRDGTCYVVAAGRANHAGAGGPIGPIGVDDGNTKRTNPYTTAGTMSFNGVLVGAGSAYRLMYSAPAGADPTGRSAHGTTAPGSPSLATSPRSDRPAGYGGTGNGSGAHGPRP